MAPFGIMSSQSYCQQHLGMIMAIVILTFWEGKATEHLLGAGIKPEHLNDDRLGRVLDKLYSFRMTERPKYCPAT